MIDYILDNNSLIVFIIAFFITAIFILLSRDSSLLSSVENVLWDGAMLVVTLRTNPGEFKLEKSIFEFIMALINSGD